MSSTTTSKVLSRDEFLDSLDTIEIESGSDDEQVHDKSCRKRYKLTLSDHDTEIESSSDDDLMLKEQVPDKSSRKRFTKKEQSKRSIHSEMVTFPLQGFISRLIHCLTISFREE